MGSRKQGESGSRCFASSVLMMCSTTRPFLDVSLVPVHLGGGSTYTCVDTCVSS